MDGIFVNPTDMVIVRWLFLRGLGVIYLVAFASFALQVRGLVGERGISPTGRYLGMIKKVLGKATYIHYPTLAWINHSDRFLLGMCLAGCLFAMLLVLGLQVTPLLVLLWILYLSLVVVGQDFLLSNGTSSWLKQASWQYFWPRQRYFPKRSSRCHHPG